MAIKIFEKFSPRANPADGNYPHGSIKNESVPGAKDGTPLDAEWGNDYAGFDAALLAEADIVPSGNPDTAVASQRLDALKSVFDTYGTVADIASGKFKAGKRVVVTDRANGLFLIESSGIPDGFGILDAGNGNTAVLQNPLWFVNPKHFGAVGDGVASDTAACAAAYAYAKSNKISVWFPTGNYKVKLTFDGSAKVYGNGLKQTFFIQEDSASWTIRLYGAGNDGFGSHLSDCSIKATSDLGIGLELGDSGGSGWSNGLVERLEVSGFSSNIRVQSAIMSGLRNIWSFGATENAIEFGSERNVTTMHIDTCRLYSSKIGAKIQAGHLVTWTNCNFESNTQTGVFIQTGVTSGPTKHIFNGCWLEDNGGDVGSPATLRAGLYLDMQASVEDTKPHDIVFNRCVFSSPTGAYDIYSARAKDVTLDHCAMNDVDGLTATKLGYAIGTAQTFIKMIQCAKVQTQASPSLYSTFPTRVKAGSKYIGYYYEYQFEGQWYRNYSQKILTITTDQTDLDVAGIETLVVETTSGNVTLDSTMNAYDGQVIRVIKPVAANSAILTHNGTGTQKIFTPAGVDYTLTGRDGALMEYYDGTWYLCSN